MYGEHAPAKRRPLLILALAGILATIPAYLLFAASPRLTLAFQMNGFEVPDPAHSTWAYVGRHYPSLFLDTVKTDMVYMYHHLAVGLALIAGITSLFTLPTKRDTLILLMRGAALGCLVIFALDPDYSGFRYELTIVPSAAVGLCILAERVAYRYTRRRTATTPEVAPASVDH